MKNTELSFNLRTRWSGVVLWWRIAHTALIVSSHLLLTRGAEFLHSPTAHSLAAQTYDLLNSPLRMEELAFIVMVRALVKLLSPCCRFPPENAWDWRLRLVTSRRHSKPFPFSTPPLTHDVWGRHSAVHYIVHQHRHLSPAVVTVISPCKQFHVTYHSIFYMNMYPSLPKSKIYGNSMYVGHVVNFILLWNRSVISVLLLSNNFSLVPSKSMPSVHSREIVTFVLVNMIFLGLIH